MSCVYCHSENVEITPKSQGIIEGSVRIQVGTTKCRTCGKDAEGLIITSQGKSTGYSSSGAWRDFDKK